MKKVLARFAMNTTLLRIAFCRSIDVGSVYYRDLEDKGDPFKKRTKVVVIDVQGGYVRYQRYFNDSLHSRGITNFLTRYMLDA